MTNQPAPNSNPSHDKPFLVIENIVKAFRKPDGSQFVVLDGI